MMSMTPRKAAIYLRISLDATGEGLAVERQRTACHGIIQARGWEVVGEYVDNSVSASDARKNRPGYDRLVEDYAAGKFDALVCYDLDRLTRQPRQLEDWIDAAESRGLAVVTANGEADLTTDGGIMYAGIKVQVARAEVRRKAARQRAAAKQRSELGRPPLGVRLTGYTTKGDLIPDEAKAVERIFGAFLEQRNLRAVARALNDDGTPTRRGKPWHPSSVQSILRNPRYAGRAVYQGQQTGGRGAWVPIVTDEDYEAAQAILDHPERVTNTGTTARKHLGSGLYLCAVCREPVSSWSQGRYRCRNGAHINRAQGPVDEFVRAVIRERLSRPDLAGMLAPAPASVAPLVEAVERIRKRLARNDADYDDGLIDGTRYKSARLKGEAELTKAQEALAAAQPAADGLVEVLTSADPVEAFSGAPLMTERAVVDFFTTVLLHKGTRYSRTFDPDTVSIEWKGRRQ